MNEEELNRKFSEYELKIMQLQRQMDEIEKAMFDMDLIKNGLGEISGKVGEEILASIGRGIFIKAKISSDKLLVDVANGSFIEKSIEETKEIIEKQKEKFSKIQNHFDSELEKLNSEITELMKKFQEEKLN